MEKYLLQNLEKEGFLGEVTLKGSNWQILAVPDVLLNLKRMFPKMNPTGTRALYLSNTPESAADLLWINQRWPLKFSDKKKVKKQADDHKKVQEEIREILLYGAKETYNLALPPREYQKIAAAITKRKKSLLLADEVGLGKTVSALTLLCDPECRPALVVVQPHLCSQWGEFFNKFLPSVKYHIAQKGKPEDTKSAEVLIISYNKLVGWQFHLEASPPKTVVFDEVQELRRPESKKYGAAKKVADQATYRLGTSGTPVTNYGGEMFHILEVINPGKLGTETEFKREWCRLAMGNKWIVDSPQALGSFLSRETVVLRRTKEHVKRELPPLIRNLHTIPFRPDILRDVEETSLELAKLILEGAFTEKGQAARQLDLKLRQATGLAKAGFVAEFCRMMLEEETPLVLTAWHRSVYEVWREQLKQFNPVFYTGSENPRQKAESKRKFVEGESNLLILSLRSGIGLDGLQHRCSTIVFGELDWSRSFHEQCIGRINREGQKSPVSANFLLADGGSDPTICQILGIKTEQAEGIVELHDEKPLTPEEERKAQEARMRTLAQNLLEKSRKNKETEKEMPPLVNLEREPG